MAHSLDISYSCFFMVLGRSIFFPQLGYKLLESMEQVLSLIPAPHRTNNSAEYPSVLN